jgi:hypothetical protein
MDPLQKSLCEQLEIDLLKNPLTVDAIQIIRQVVAHGAAMLQIDDGDHTLTKNAVAEYCDAAGYLFRTETNAIFVVNWSRFEI